MTQVPDPDSERADPDLTTAPPAQPTGYFALEGRPAAGLYVVAWLVGAVGLGLLFIALQTPPPVGGLLLMGALLTLAVGFASAAGYQIIARRSRPESAFHGASPLLLLGIQLVMSVAFGIAWLVLGVPDPSGSAIGFLVIALTLLVSYFLVVWIFG